MPMKMPLGSIRRALLIYLTEGFLGSFFEAKVAFVPSFKPKRLCLSQALLLLLSCLSPGCGGADIPNGITPLNADYVLSVFELQSSVSGPCSALMGVSSDQIGVDGWAACFPVEAELLSVMECLRGDEAVLYESTGQVAGWGVSRAGWDLFSKRRTRGDELVSISGHGELALSLGEKDGERVLFTEMQVRHKSGKLSIDDKLRYEGAFPSNTSLLFYRFLDDRPSAPQLCVVLELQE